MKNYIILIGGGSGVGKSTLAKYFSEEYKLLRIYADDVRIAMQSISSSKRKINRLRDSEFVLNSSVENLVKTHAKIASQVSKGLKIIIAHHQVINESIVIEGVDIDPLFVVELKKKYSNIYEVFLNIDLFDEYKKNHLKRARDIPNDKIMLDKILEFEFQNALRISKQAKKLGLNVIDSFPYESIIERTRKYLYLN